MAIVFFAYSHKDKDLRDELEIHLSALKRQGVIQTWHDRRIGAGKHLDTEISSNLENAQIILLLISPYFIASEYCYNIEMKRALERNDNGEALVIPIILHPCDWQHTPLGGLNATPTDGKPISKFPNQHEAFLEIVSAIRLAVQEIDQTSPNVPVDTKLEAETKPITEKIAINNPRSSNLRVSREFTDIELSRFLSETFEYITNFFENSLRELESREEGIETEFRKIDTNTFTGMLYRKGEQMSVCKILLHSASYSHNEIRYSSSIEGNSWNESVTITDDGYTLGLKLGFQLSSYDSDSILSQDGLPSVL